MSANNWKAICLLKISEMPSTVVNAWNDNKFMMYSEAFDEIGEAASVAAVDHLRRTSKERPAICELYQFADKFNGVKEYTADEIENEIFKALREYGRMGKRVPGHDILTLGTPPLTEMAFDTVQRLGGWIPFCNREGDEKFIRADVRRIAGQAIEAQKTQRAIQASLPKVENRPLALKGE